VTETRDQLALHLEALEEFEPKYRAYIAELKRPPSDEIHLNFSDSTPPEANDGGWSNAEMETRKDELLELAPAVDDALLAANLDLPALGHPPAIGGGLMARGVPSLLFNHGPVGLDESGYAMPTAILQKVVGAKGALRSKLKRRPTSPVNLSATRAEHPHRWPKVLFGRLRFIPASIGFIADLGGCAVVIYAVGKFLHVW
jgi:hypothetical protein